MIDFNTVSSSLSQINLNFNISFSSPIFGLLTSQFDSTVISPASALLTLKFLDFIAERSKSSSFSESTVINSIWNSSQDKSESNLISALTVNVVFSQLSIVTSSKSEISATSSLPFLSSLNFEILSPSSL